MKIKLIWSLLAGSLAIIGLVTVVSISTTHRYPPIATSSAVTVNTVTITKPDVNEIFTLVNQERTAAGLPALIRDTRLDASAAAKCADMDRLDVVEHNLPDGTGSRDFILAQMGTGKPFIYGENLAWNYGTSQYDVSGWMNSPGHKANILKPTYTNVGYAMCDVSLSYKNVVVQHFVGL